MQRSPLLDDIIMFMDDIIIPEALDMPLLLLFMVTTSMTLEGDLHRGGCGGASCRLAMESSCCHIIDDDGARRRGVRIGGGGMVMGDGGELMLE